jgi:nucleoside-diphosphate kinase
MSEKTLAIIKPDAVKKRVTGKILSRIEDEGFTIQGLRMRSLTKEDAEGFYAVHRDKIFFTDLTDFMSSGPIVTMVLERENAIKHWRTVMGATNPAEADPGTIRRNFGFSIERNATHGSDAPETAAFEIDYFYKK